VGLWPRLVAVNADRSENRSLARQRPLSHGRASRRRFRRARGWCQRRPLGDNRDRRGVGCRRGGDVRRRDLACYGRVFGDGGLHE